MSIITNKSQLDPTCNNCNRIQISPKTIIINYGPDIDNSDNNIIFKVDHRILCRECLFTVKHTCKVCNKETTCDNFRKILSSSLYNEICIPTFKWMCITCVFDTICKPYPNLGGYRSEYFSVLHKMWQQSEHKLQQCEQQLLDATKTIGQLQSEKEKPKLTEELTKVQTTQKLQEYKQKLLEATKTIEQLESEKESQKANLTEEISNLQSRLIVVSTSLAYIRAIPETTTITPTNYTAKIPFDTQLYTQHLHCEIHKLSKEIHKKRYQQLHTELIKRSIKHNIEMEISFDKTTRRKIDALKQLGKNPNYNIWKIVQTGLYDIHTSLIKLIDQEYELAIAPIRKEAEAISTLLVSLESVKDIITAPNLMEEMDKLKLKLEQYNKLIVPIL